MIFVFLNICELNICEDAIEWIKTRMRRYVNWSLILLCAIVAAMTLISPTWLPEVQPYLIEQADTIDFECVDYVTDAECVVLESMYDDDPEHAIAQQQAMNPDNNFTVRDLEPAEIAETLRTSFGSSDSPEIIQVKQGVFSPPLDAIHNARGRVQLIRIVTLDQQGEVAFLRLDSGVDGDFSVTNGPNSNLRIYLSTDLNPEGGDDFESRALDLGVLKGNVGRQNYDLNTDLDLQQYRSVVIYNPDYDQIFGIAQFVEQ